MSQALPGMLQSKRLLVCGGAGTLAADIAEEAVRLGAEAYLAGPDTLKASPGRAASRLVTGPLDTEPGVEALFAALEERDVEPAAVILVLSAPQVGLLADLSLEEWSAAVTDPLRTAFLVSRHAADGHLAAGVAGRLVLVAAPADRSADNDVLSTSLFSLVRSISKEYGRRGIAANAVVAAVSGDPSEPRAFVDAALFLASGEASFIAGEVLTIAGDPGPAA